MRKVAMVTQHTRPMDLHNLNPLGRFAIASGSVFVTVCRDTHFATSVYGTGITSAFQIIENERWEYAARGLEYGEHSVRCCPAASKLLRPTWTVVDAQPTRVTTRVMEKVQRNFVPMTGQFLAGVHHKMEAGCRSHQLVASAANVANVLSGMGKAEDHNTKRQAMLSVYDPDLEVYKIVERKSSEMCEIRHLIDFPEECAGHGGWEEAGGKPRRRATKKVRISDDGAAEEKPSKKGAGPSA
eukprot:gene26721-32830_t